jgi:hypothetical protein
LIAVHKEQTATGPFLHKHRSSGFNLQFPAKSDNFTKNYPK